MDLESNRKLCLEQQTKLREIMTNSDQHEQAMQLFFRQHAMLHSAKMADAGLWSFEDAIMDDMTDENVRRIPQNSEHSVAWPIWHIARIEDVAMNLLVAGSSQVLHQDDWLERMSMKVQNTGNAMPEEDMADLSARIDIAALRAYRVAVGRRTREIVERLGPQDLKAKVDPARLQQVMDQGALLEEAVGVRDYWGKRTIAGLLLMPATRHNLVHLNEALQIKQRRK